MAGAWRSLNLEIYFLQPRRLRHKVIFLLLLREAKRHNGAYGQNVWEEHALEISGIEFFPGKGKFCPLPFIFIILNRKGDLRVCHTFYAVVADGNPVSILAQIFDNGFRTTKRLFTIRDPFLRIARVQKFFESIMIFVGFSSAVECQPFVRP